MITEDFYGKKQFIWWTGIVEDVKDPLELGSVRVRIIGLHSENKNLVPTDSLPWAQVLLPVTGANTTTGPREGDWVFGFFQDGEQAQIPVVMGVFPGIESVQSSIVYREAATREGGTQNKPRPSQVDRVVGEPTVVRIARGELEGTLINVLNQDRKHVCDISPEVTKATDWIRTEFSLAIDKLRKAIRAILLALGFDPSGEISTLVQAAKAIAREIKKITDDLRDINARIQRMVEIARQIKAMIDYILSLPEKTRKFLNECLQQFYKSLSTGIADLFAKPLLGVSSGDFKELTDAFNDITKQSKMLLAEVAQTLTLPAQVSEAILNPASSGNLLQAEQQFNQFLSNNFPSAEELINQSSTPINTAQV
jgi:hypothetical protein